MKNDDIDIEKIADEFVEYIKSGKKTGIICADCGKELDWFEKPAKQGECDHSEGFICLSCNRFFPGLDFEGDECDECSKKR